MQKEIHSQQICLVIMSKQHIKKEGRDNCLTEIPKNVVIIEAAMFDKYNEWYTRSFKIKVYNKCGDTDIRSCHTKKLILI